MSLDDCGALGTWVDCNRLRDSGLLGIERYRFLYGIDAAIPFSKSRINLQYTILLHDRRVAFRRLLLTYRQMNSMAD